MPARAASLRTGGGKIEMLVIHHEAENTPADAAAEAMKGLPLPG